MKTENYAKTIKSERKNWHQELVEKLGIVDEGDIVSLIDLEERTEFDERILSLLERGEPYGRGI